MRAFSTPSTLRSCRVIAGAFVMALSSAATWPGPAVGSSGVPLHRVAHADLCVTNGLVSALPGDRLAVNSASSRAVAPGSTGTSAFIRFRYLGPSADSKPLASGEVRRQIGLKLRASDTCNLVYVMWHIQPDAQVSVSIKRNPGRHSHAACHAGGYTRLKATSRVDLPRINPGEQHTLRAELQPDRIEVFADERPVWTGSLMGTVIDFDGPAGFRTDNARFEIEYLVAARTGAQGPSTMISTPNHCADEPAD